MVLSFSLHAQIDQDQMDDDTSIENVVDDIVKHIETTIEELDLDVFFKEKIPELYEDVRPTDEQLDEIDEKVKEGLSKIKEFDASKLDDLARDVEEGLKDILEELPDVKTDRKPKKV